MASISERALRLRDHCLDGGAWPRELLENVIRDTATPEGTSAFFAVVIEPLGDLFESR